MDNGKAVFGVFFSGPPDTSSPLVLVKKWEEGVLCVLLAIDWMHLVGSHIITCDLMHC